MTKLSKKQEERFYKITDELIINGDYGWKYLRRMDENENAEGTQEDGELFTLLNEYFDVVLERLGKETTVNLTKEEEGNLNHNFLNFCYDTMWGLLKL